MRVLRRFDPWKSQLCTCPPKYSLHPYTGCSHFCLYCYATSYIGRHKSSPKKNFIKNLLHDLKRADKSLPVAISTSSDPYPPEENKYCLTRRAVEALLDHGFKIIIVSKSNLVIRDINLFKKGRVTVSLTITTLDDRLAKIIEPFAPPPRERVEAIRLLTRADIPVSVRIDPIIWGLNDDPQDLRELVRVVSDAGAKHVVASVYKVKPDNLARLSAAFPDLADKWHRLYFGEGESISGYRYLRRNLRMKLLFPVVDEAARLNVSYATCREGLLSKTFFNAPSCDGTHLLNYS